MSQWSPDMRTRPSAAAANGWLVVILVLLAAALLYRTLADGVRNRPNYQPRITTPRGDLGDDEKNNVSVFEAVSPSVVFVRTKGSRWTRFGQMEEREVSAGTGIVWDESGHIVTNLHVVQQTLEDSDGALEVQLRDNAVYDAQIVGAMARFDIAVLRIDAEPAALEPITIGTSNDLKVGQKVLAIGNPFGFDRTLSTGVIGGLDRSVPDNAGQVLGGMIQTDAAINPGNSGGPLLDSAGRLIGVNTAIVSTSGASAGLGFAVPVNDVLTAVNEILQASTTDQSPSMGVSILDRATATANGIPEEWFEGGLMILQVYPNTPASRAGLRGCMRQGFRVIPGDLIVSVDGTPVSSLEALRKVLASRRVGDRVVVQILRGNQRGEVELILESRRVLL
ncbi:MAG: S1C family serine protease [Planctomycetota bacterium]